MMRAAPTDKILNERCKVCSRRKTAQSPSFDYAFGNAPGGRLLAQAAHDILKPGLIVFIYNTVGSQTLRSIHAHIKGSLALKTEPASSFIQLRTRHAQVQQDSVDLAPPVCLCDFCNLSMVASYNLKTTYLHGFNLCDGLIVAVDAKHLAAHSDNFLRMASPPKSSIHIPSARFHRQSVYCLA
jgi:hypothetical protein